MYMGGERRPACICTHTNCMYMSFDDHPMQLCVCVCVCVCVCTHARTLLLRFFLYDDNTFHSHVSAFLCVNGVFAVSRIANIAFGCYIAHRLSS